MDDLSVVLSSANILLTIGSVAGGIWAFRNGITRTANEIQERVIHALEIELENMRQRLDDMREENIRLTLLIETICLVLKSKQMTVSIDGDLVSIRDGSGQTTTRIHKNLLE